MKQYLLITTLMLLTIACAQTLPSNTSFYKQAKKDALKKDKANKKTQAKAAKKKKNEQNAKQHAAAAKKFEKSTELEHGGYDDRQDKSLLANPDSSKTW